MKAALAVTRVTRDLESNIQGILRQVAEAASAGADLVLFPEAAVTGLVNNDDPSHDLPLGQAIPGPVTRRIAAEAARHSIYVALGILELDSGALYDSAVLFDPAGEIAMKYRRISRGWHGPRCDPSVYRHGASIEQAPTPLGSTVFLICGDLFDDSLVERVRNMHADYVLCPMSRCYDTLSYDQERWKRETKWEYAERAASLRTAVLVVNSLAEPEVGGDFGGALVIGPTGEILAELPIGQEGLLLADLPGHA